MTLVQLDIRIVRFHINLDFGGPFIVKTVFCVIFTWHNLGCFKLMHSAEMGVSNLAIWQKKSNATKKIWAWIGYKSADFC